MQVEIQHANRVSVCFIDLPDFRYNFGLLSQVLVYLLNLALEPHIRVALASSKSKLKALLVVLVVNYKDLVGLAVKRDVLMGEKDVCFVDGVDNREVIVFD